MDWMSRTSNTVDALLSYVTNVVANIVALDSLALPSACQGRVSTLLSGYQRRRDCYKLKAAVKANGCFDVLWSELCDLFRLSVAIIVLANH